MRYNFKNLMFITIAFFTLSNCKTAKGIEVKDENIEDALLWKITGKGVTKPSYIYGTIHMIPSNEYFLPQGTLTAIDQCEKMIFEIDMADMSDMSSLMGIMDKIFMNNDVTLKTLLTSEEYKLVEDKFSSLGLPMFMLDKIKPMFLSAMTYGDMSPTSIQDGSIKSYEMEFYDMAKQRKMDTGGLETIEFQLSVFDSIPYPVQAKMLVESLKSTDSEDDEFQKMIALYKGQRINEMIEMIGSDESGLSGYEDILVKKRNEMWIDQIISNAREKQVFFAVGAGHLAGKNGVIRLLREKGMKLTPIKA